METKDLTIGRVYQVHHSRKGSFTMRVDGVDGEWIKGVIVDGVAKALLADNVAYEGDSLTIRDCHSLFYELPDAAPSQPRSPEGV